MCSSSLAFSLYTVSLCQSLTALSQYIKRIAPIGGSLFVRLFEHCPFELVPVYDSLFARLFEPIFSFLLYDTQHLFVPEMNSIAGNRTTKPRILRR